VEPLSPVDRFFEACAQGDVASLRRLLADDPALARASNPRGQYGGWTGLHSAAQAGHLDAVRLLLEKGANPNAREDGDNTYPLHWAAASGHVEIVRALLDAGGDVHGTGDAHAMTVIGWASFHHAPGDHPAELSPQARDTLALLVERGARHHIFSAICAGDCDLIRQVVAADPKALDRRMSRFEHGLTPLHFAINRKRYDIVDVLIEQGADLEAADGRGETALEAAMMHGDREAMRRLQAAGAKPPEAIDPETVQGSLEVLSASIRKGVPMIMVPDVTAALEWYVSIGFTEVAQYGEGGVLSFAMVSFGNAELMLNVHGTRGPHEVSLWFYTDQIDQLYRLLKGRQFAAVATGQEGIEFTESLNEPFYGGRQFGIRDLNGFHLYFMQDN
jgi:cytohesin